VATIESAIREPAVESAAVFGRSFLPQPIRVRAARVTNNELDLLFIGDMSSLSMAVFWSRTAITPKHEIAKSLSLPER
jgi:hypothetical protein